MPAVAAAAVARGVAAVVVPRRRAVVTMLCHQIIQAESCHRCGSGSNRLGRFCATVAAEKRRYCEYKG